MLRASVRGRPSGTLGNDDFIPAWNWQLESGVLKANYWHLQFDFDSAALPQLLDQRLGRTVLLTNRMDWSAEQVVAGDAAQQHIERVFCGLKDGQWLGWDSMYHWTDPKTRIHAFYCMLGISLLQYVHKQAQAAWTDLSIEQLLQELEHTPGKDSRQIVTLANVGLLELGRCEAQTIRVILEILIAGALLTDQIYLYDAMSYSLCCKRV